MEHLASALLAFTAIGAGTVVAAPPAAEHQAEHQDDGKTQAEDEPEEASPEVAERLLDAVAVARRAKTAEALRAALEGLAGYTNEDFAAPAIAALKYRASRDDKKAAKAEAADLGDRSPKAVERLVQRRVAEVQIAAARALETHPEPSVGKALLAAFTRKDVTKDKPVAAAAFVHAMGVIGYRDAQDEIAKVLSRHGQRDVFKACVRYLGQVKTTDLGAVRQLCDLLAAPQPGNVDAATNPPASYWEERWKTWQHVRRDASWALREITGETFQPAESEGEGDRRRAREFVDEHARELGLK